VEAAAIVPMAMAGGTKDATAPAMSAPIACQSIMSFMGKAQDLALDRVASVPDQAILQRLQRRVACRGTEVEGDSDRRSAGPECTRLRRPRSRRPIRSRFDLSLVEAGRKSHRASIRPPVGSEQLP
jgi:hypothetical protein